MIDLRARIQKILDDQACIEGYLRAGCERICLHDDHNRYMWPEGEAQCNGASELLPLLRDSLEETTHQVSLRYSSEPAPGLARPETWAEDEGWSYCLGCGNEVPEREKRADHTCGDGQCIENVRLTPGEPL